MMSKETNSEKIGNESPLKSLEKDLLFYEDPIKEVSKDIRKSGISRFPIFIAYQHEVKLGELILSHEELGTSWSINASTMEDFLEKNLILKEKQDFFEINYKDPNKFICLFVMVPEGANFVFFPYH